MMRLRLPEMRAAASGRARPAVGMLSGRGGLSRQRHPPPGGGRDRDCPAGRGVSSGPRARPGRAGRCSSLPAGASPPRSSAAISRCSGAESAASPWRTSWGCGSSGRSVSRSRQGCWCPAQRRRRWSKPRWRSGARCRRRRAASREPRADELRAESRESSTEGPTIVELCTGSGAVAIALATEIPTARILATDVSWRALRVARANALAHAVAGRIAFLRGNLWQAVNGQAPAGSVDLVVANPPYVPTRDVATLMPEIQWEPRLALDGGADGLRVQREIIATSPERIRPGGCAPAGDRGEPGRGDPGAPRRRRADSRPVGSSATWRAAPG